MSRSTTLRRRRFASWAGGPINWSERPALAGVNPEDLPRVQETVAALKRGETEETRITYRTRHREKSEIWVESTLRVTRNSGEIDGVVAITRDVTQQKNLEGKLETLATVDGLTGLANRRRFDERLLEEWARAYRERTSLSLLMIDLDHFKTYNDEYGHPAGDECLRAVARILAAEAKRTTDLAARYGGEEFVMLLPNTDAAGCARIGETVLREIRDAGIAAQAELPVANSHREHRRGGMPPGRRTLGGPRLAGRGRRPGALCREGSRARPAR